MEKTYIVRSKKIVTVSDEGTILDGAIVVKKGKIEAIGKWNTLKMNYSNVKVYDYADFVITPSLVDCHTHLLEFAPSALYPITKETHRLAVQALLLQAVCSGITAIGEQICGHPESTFSVEDYRRMAEEVPLDISFALTSISIGFAELAHFSAWTKNKRLSQNDLFDEALIQVLAEHSDYPGENLFINATPANFTKDIVPRAGELMYTYEQIRDIVKIFHRAGKQIGVHVAEEEGISRCLLAEVDVLHHAHGITAEQMKQAQRQGTKIVSTPLGGTHIEPNAPEQIAQLVKHGITVAIATDAYLPPYPNVHWLPFKDESLKGPEVLLEIASPSMQLLYDDGLDENEVLALITKNPAIILQKDDRFGSLAPGMDANFLTATGVPGIDFTDVSEIKAVFFQGKQVVNRLKI